MIGISPEVSNLYTYFSTGYFSNSTSSSVTDRRFSSNSDPSFRGMYRVYLKLVKKKQEMLTCNWLDSETLGSWHCAQKPPGTLWVGGQ